ncbi:helix-turn-helix domain-containing protein [Pseudonocardia kujensis]|uniref:PucR family transcriptional regulator n=1 Tax=Pseudonocardia kujensis TaxID=1128675 RepID=UPI001E3524BC|nr:helix-turn-helix domain-containing protein [Pseudonocardia kujensis]MCE0768456.1 helix-turn-helix domain-containing protein [Pseudonocardia kujensis]
MVAADSRASEVATVHARRRIAQEITADEVRRLRKLVARCSHLSAAAAQQTEIGDVVQLLATQTASVIAVLDRSLDIFASAGGTDPAAVFTAMRERAGPAGFSSMLAAVAHNRRALTVPGGDRGTSVVVAPVSVGDDIAGYLVAISDDDRLGEDMMLLAGEHAAMLCGVLLGRDLVVTAAAGRARRELVEGLLLARGHDDGEASRSAQHLGYDESRDHAVVAIALSEDGSAGQHAVVEKLLARLVGDAIVASRTDEVVAIIPSVGGAGAVERAADVAIRCVAELQQRAVAVGAVGVGVGNNCRSPADIARSYSEAQRAVAAGERIGTPGQVQLFAELGIHRLLLRIQDVGELRAFGEEVVGKLLEEDAATGMQYLPTLAVYFAENSSPSKAAQRLHVHPNTVSYRIRRVEEITLLRLDVHRDRLMAEVAVQILEVLRSRR